jgi:hypothetical protein
LRSHFFQLQAAQSSALEGTYQETIEIGLFLVEYGNRRNVLVEHGADGFPELVFFLQTDHIEGFVRLLRKRKRKKKKKEKKRENTKKKISFYLQIVRFERIQKRIKLSFRGHSSGHDVIGSLLLIKKNEKNCKKLETTLRCPSTTWSSKESLR